MSRRAAVIDEFDDDVDLPLPARPLPNTGSRGAILREITDDDDGNDDYGNEDDGNEAPPPRRPAAGPASSQQPGTVTDITPYKKCVAIYSLSQTQRAYQSPDAVSGGHVSIPSTLTQSSRTALALAVYLAKRVCGGH